jgi:hypothetical protein
LGYSQNTLDKSVDCGIIYNIGENKMSFTVNGNVFKSLLFSNKGIKATTFDGLVVRIPIKILDAMIVNSNFFVEGDGKDVVANGFTFVVKERKI